MYKDPKYFVYVRQMNQYLTEIGFFRNSQYGFQAASSTQDAAFQVINSLITNKRKFSGVIFIDLKRAFETVNHERLLAKMRRIGMSLAAVNLMRSFLKREIVTDFNGFLSDRQEVRTGIGQGTILGPLQFILYLNDIFDVSLKGDLTLYADDAALVYACDSLTQLETTMQEDLVTFHKWLIVNLLTLNVAKTQYMLFGKARKKDDLQLLLGTERITRTHQFKYLGLYLDPKLSFDCHINYLRRKIAPMTGLMWRCQRYIPIEKKKQLYFAFVASHVSYMMAIWGANLHDNKIKQLRVVQNKALKSLFGLPRLTPTTYLYSINVLPIEILLMYERMLNVYKMRNGLSKHGFTINTNQEEGIRQTRQSYQLFVPSTFGQQHQLLQHLGRRNDANNSPVVI